MRAGIPNSGNAISEFVFEPNPVIAIISIAFGLSASLALLPDHVNSVDDIFWSALVFSLGLVLAPAISFFRSPSSLIKAETIIMLGLVYWLFPEVLQGVFALYIVDRASIYTAFSLVGVFALAIWCGALLFRRVYKAPFNAVNFEVEITSNALFFVICFCFLLSMFWYFSSCNFNLSCMLDSLSGSRFDRPWRRSRLGGWGAFVEHLRYFGFLIPALTVFLWSKKRAIDWQVWGAIFLGLIFVLYASRGGSRREIGAMLGAAALGWLCFKRQLKATDYIKVSVALGVILWFLQLMIDYRDLGWEYIFKDDVLTEAYIETQVESDYIKVDKNFERLARLVSVVPAIHEYVYFQQIYYVLVRPIPRALWPGKPVGPGFDLATALGYQPGLILKTSIVGDWYLIAGWSSVLVGGLLTGFLAVRISSILLVPGEVSRLLYALLFMPVFVGLRSMEELVVMSYPALALLLFLTYKKLLKHKLPKVCDYASKLD